MTGKKFITVICRCGNSRVVQEEICLQYPSGSIVCCQLTKEMKICRLQYPTTEILKKARGGMIADFSQPEVIQESLIK
jgi:hypothetical protein